MPNHIHLLLAVKNHIDDMDIAQGKIQDNSAIKRANDTIPHVISTFKRFCNREIGENIFQRSYYDHIIRNIQDYDETVKYIYYNPRRWYLKYRIPKR
jgi:REP element-mobilizing transposase RayT